MVKQIQAKIDEEITKLSSTLVIPPTELYEPARYMLSLGGKRIRPLMVLLASHLFDGVTEEAIPAALAIELFHNFTLVHDDIMDNAPLRRNHKTVHKKWNVSTAILSGDVMLVKAYQLLSSGKNLSSVLPIFNAMATQVCEGQQWDMNYESAQHPVTVAQYFKMIELKTAVLIAAAMQMGALVANASASDATLCYNFGKNIGIAFQLQDDVLDVYGKEEKFGKQHGGDILSNKKTFLLLKAIELCSLNPYKKEELAQWMAFTPANEKENAQKIESVKAIYSFCNVKNRAETEINAYHQKALIALDKISASADKKKMLIDFANSLLVREL